MNPSYLYAALLDVLGYRLFLEKDRQSGRLDFQGKLSAALAALGAVNEAVFGVRAISDTVILTCSEHGHFPEFLELLRCLFVAFSRAGYLHPWRRCIFSAFPERTIDIQSRDREGIRTRVEVAGYPRIVIDNNIVAMYQTGSGLPNIALSGLLCL